MNFMVSDGFLFPTWQYILCVFQSTVSKGTDQLGSWEALSSDGRGLLRPCSGWVVIGGHEEERVAGKTNMWR